MRKTPITFVDITGAKFGYWTALERVANRYGKAYYKCRCRCGTEREVGKQQLEQGKTKSCGCYGMHRTPKARPEQHGKAWSPKEIEILKTYYPINGKKTVAKLTGRTPESVNTMAKKHKVKVTRHIYPRDDKWSETELERLRTLYREGGIRACRGKFKFRSETAIKTKAWEMGIKSEMGYSSPRNRLSRRDTSLAA